MAKARSGETTEDEVRALGDWFYNWELRGRGWQAWKYPVALEPPFRALDAVPDISCGLREDARRYEAGTSLPPWREPWAEAAERGPVWECLSLPAAQWPAGIIDPLTHLLSFELWSVGGRISEAIAVSAEDFGEVAQCMCRRDGAVAQAADEFARALEDLPPAFRFVELGLAREFLIPMVNAAPHAVVRAREVLATLGRGEFASVQILMSPLREAWADEMIRAARGPSGDGLFDDDLVAACRAKIEKPLFAVSVRIAAFAPNEARADLVASELSDVFLAPATAETNGLIALQPSVLDRETVLADLGGRMSHRSGMILNAAELSLLLPIGPRDAAMGARLRLSPADRLREMRVVGEAGRTRTNFVVDFVLHDLEERNAVALIDCDGSFAEIVMRRLPRHRLADVTLIDPSRAPVPIDLLNADSRAERSILEGDVIAVLSGLSSGWGASASAQFSDLVAALREQDAVPTLADLNCVLVDRRSALASALDVLLGDDAIRAVLAGGGRPFDFRRLLEGGVLLARLPAERYGAERSDALAGVLLAKLHQAFATCAERKPFFVYLVGAGPQVRQRALSLAPVARRCGAGIVVVEPAGDVSVPRSQVFVTCRARSRLARIRLGDAVHSVEVPDLPAEPHDAAQSVLDVVSVTARRHGLPDNAFVTRDRSDPYPKIPRRAISPQDMVLPGVAQNP